MCLIDFTKREIWMGLVEVDLCVVGVLIVELELKCNIKSPRWRPSTVP